MSENLHKKNLAEHGNEWTRIQEGFRNINTPEMQYRVRCIEGLLTGNTLDYGATL